MNKKIDIEKIKDRILNCNALDVQQLTEEKTANKSASILSQEYTISSQLNTDNFENEYKQFIYEQQLIYKILEMLKPYINDYIDSKIEASNKPKSKRIPKK